MNLPNIVVKFSLIEEYNLAKKYLATWFEKTKPIPKTNKIHSIIPQKNRTFIVKKISNFLDYKMYKKVKKKTEK